uniref:Uncharacterized protein n=1 Tax=Eutreptiella gymnastica TaxID=73025 RepID=A0A7S1INH2_9EUGL
MAQPHSAVTPLPAGLAAAQVEPPTALAGPGPETPVGLLLCSAMVFASLGYSLWQTHRPQWALFTATSEKSQGPGVAADADAKWMEIMGELAECERAKEEKAAALAAQTDQEKLLTSLTVFSIPVFATAFILQAYFFGTPLAGIMARKGWLFAHVVSGMLFGGIVIFSTLYEGLVILQGNPDTKRWWFERVPAVDGVVALPAVFLSIASGVCLSQVNFGSLYAAPKFVHFALEMLLIFVAFWATMDTRTQPIAKANCEEDWKVYMLTGKKPDELRPVLKTRLWVNAVSSGLVIVIYWIMCTKPNFKLEDLFM